MNHTSLYDWHTSNGGRMVEFAGWEMPIQYTSIVHEHSAVRKCAGLFDIAHMGRLQFSGPDARRFLDYLLTCDVAGLKVGQVRYSLICNADGGILDDVLVYRFDDFYQLVVNASNRPKIVAWINQHRDDFDVEVADVTMETFMLALQGPESTSILQPHTPDDLATLKYYSAIQGRVDSLPTILSRTGYTGEDGFELIISADEGGRVWDLLLQTGQSLGLVPCGLGARDTLRLEAAMPLYGHEMDESTDPYTAGLAFAVKLDGDDFIGKSALLRLNERSAQVRRAGLLLDGRRIARQGAIVSAESRHVGSVTSGTFSPTLERSIAMARVDTASAHPEAVLQVDIRGHRTTASVVRLPFYRRQADLSASAD